MHNPLKFVSEISVRKLDLDKHQQNQMNVTLKI